VRDVSRAVICCSLTQPNNGFPEIGFDAGVTPVTGHGSQSS